MNPVLLLKLLFYHLFYRNVGPLRLYNWSLLSNDRYPKKKKKALKNLSALGQILWQIKTADNICKSF